MHFNGAVSYITGSHTFKVGTNWHNGNHTFGAEPNFSDYYLFFFQRPIAITSISSPHRQRSELDMVLGLFAQDSWTLDRLTLNVGIRYDHIVASSPAQTRPAGFYTEEVFFAERKNIPNWKSIHPAARRRLRPVRDGPDRRQGILRPLRGSRQLRSGLRAAQFPRGRDFHHHDTALGRFRWRLRARL